MSGHIERRGSRVFYVSVEGPRDPITGGRTRKGRTVHGTKKDAQDVLDQLAVGARDNASGARSTMDSLIQQWAAIAEQSVSPVTMRGYRVQINRHISPALGKLQVGDVATADLDRLYVALAKRKGLAASSIRQVHVVIRQALQQAVQWDWIPRNPAERATVPRQERPHITPPSIEEVMELIEVAYLADPALGNFLRLAASTGARRGELCALRWRHLDFDAGEMLIDASIAEHEGLLEKDTKTHASRRIALDAGSLVVLENQKQLADSRAKRERAVVGPDSFIFSDRPDGARPWAPSWVSRYFADIRRGAGLERVRLHDLRHFAATQMMVLGVPVRTISGRLGHANPSTTLSVYSHFIAASDRDAADALGSRMDQGVLPERTTSETSRPRPQRSSRPVRSGKKKPD